MRKGDYPNEGSHLFIFPEEEGRNPNPTGGGRYAELFAVVVLIEVEEGEVRRVGMRELLQVAALLLGRPT